MKTECGAYLDIDGFGGGTARVYCDRGVVYPEDHEQHFWSDGQDATIHWTDKAIGAGTARNTSRG